MIHRPISWLWRTVRVASRPFSLAALVLALSVGTLFTGCQSIGGKSAAFPAPAAGWQTYTGQLFYRGANGKSVIGDVVIRRSAHGDFQLEFLSGPGVSLMRLQRSATALHLEGILARGSWNPPLNRVPAPLRGWSGLPAIFDAANRSHQAAFSLEGDQVKAAYSGSRLSKLDVAPAVGGHFAFQFSR